MSVSRKSVIRICILCVFAIVFSGAAYFPEIISVSADKVEGGTDDGGAQYRQSCDMCLPPDNEKGGSNSEISERIISTADFVRASYGVPVNMRAESERNYAMYILSLNCALVYGRNIRCGTVMRC